MYLTKKKRHLIYIEALRNYQDKIKHNIRLGGMCWYLNDACYTLYAIGKPDVNLDSLRGFPEILKHKTEGIIFGFWFYPAYTEDRLRIFNQAILETTPKV